MIGRTRRLADLALVAALLAERASAPVAKAQDRLRAQKGQIDGLVARRAALSLDGADPVVAARLARLAEHLRQEHAAAMVELARAQAECDIARQAVRPAVARKAVLERLVHKASGPRR